MAIGKLLIFGGLAAGLALVLMPKKASAKGGGSAPLPAPPLQGVPVDMHPDVPGGVVVVPQTGEAHEVPPMVVQPLPEPLTVPPGGPPPFFPPLPAAQPAPVQLPPEIAAQLPPEVAEAVQTLPGIPLEVPPDVLQAGADILQQAGIPVARPDLIPVPEVTPVIEMPPMVVEPSDHPAEQPTAIHPDTLEVLGVMLPQETTASWKHLEPAIKPWQESRGLVADQKYGPKSALKMAEETGLLPIVRYWPTSAIKSTAVPKFRDQLLALAATAEEPRASQLRAAAARETGQGFGSKQSPISPTIAI